TFSAEWVLDLEVSYDLGKASLAAGVQNLFDNFPDRNIPLNFNLGIFTYPRNAPFGFNGRYVYLRTAYKF
ncbi:MAG: TonB-dependent receptor, partial [Acidobacteriota bacterium]|nr:TonB-dependent receptor [Acidobacteriota bacterium]